MAPARDSTGGGAQHMRLEVTRRGATHGQIAAGGLMAARAGFDLG
jgi:hypothetical protein